MTYNVVIPCSGPGSRSSSYSKFHKALVRIGDRAVISHIIDSYPDANTIYIMLGHNGEYIRQYIELCNYTNVEFINIDNWQESQISSLQQIPEYVFDTPFYLNSCDNWTSEVPKVGTNTVFLCKPENMDYYDTVNNKAFAGIGFIHDTIEWREALLNTDATRNDYLVYAELENLAHMDLDTWYDIGNTESLKVTQQHFTDKFDLLDKLHQEIYFVNNKIVKLFNKPVDSVKKSITSSRAFPHPGPVMFTENGLSYDYVEGKINAEDQDYDRVLSNLTMLWDFCINNNTKTNSAKIWQHKTQERFDMMIKKYPEFSKTIKVNWHTIDPVRTIESIDWTMMNTGIYGPCHGDLILENIVVAPDAIHYIDHREGVVTDIFYDICKFYHNLHLNNINMKQFTLTEKDGYQFDIEYDNIARLIQFQQTDIYKKHKAKINTGVGCVWLSMAPLNVSNELNKFLFLYAIEHLHRTINERF